MTGKERKALAKKIVDAVLNDGALIVDGTKSLAVVDVKTHVGRYWVICRIYQRRPYTNAVIAVKSGRDKWLDAGFTKVCFPDEWSAAYGVELAVRKAAKAVTHQM